MFSKQTKNSKWLTTDQMFDADKLVRGTDKCTVCLEKSTVLGRSCFSKNKVEFFRLFVRNQCIKLIISINQGIFMRRHVQGLNFGAVTLLTTPS